MSRTSERSVTDGGWHWWPVVLAVLILGSAPTTGAGTASTLEGVITTRATALPAIRVTVDPRVCGTQLPDEAILVDEEGRLANAVVTLVGVKATGTAPSPMILNDQCRFVPRVQVVPPGSTVRSSSKDAVLHTTTVQDANGRPLFSLALPVPGLTMSKAVGAPGMARVTCNTHPWMRGWLVVTDEMAAVTDAHGRFRLENVPAGTYELRVWHEALQPASRKVTIAEGKPATVEIELR
jgi:hypothetical protein